MIKSMYGTCDGKDIVFHEVAKGQWECAVPADLNDGTYVVEIWAVSYIGEVIYTTATLYMCDARCVYLELVDDIRVNISTNEYNVRTICKKPMVIECDGLMIRVGVRKYNVKVVKL